MEKAAKVFGHEARDFTISVKTGRWRRAAKDRLRQAEVGCKPVAKRFRWRGRRRSRTQEHRQWSGVKHEHVDSLVCQWEVCRSGGGVSNVDTARYLLPWCHHFTRTVSSPTLSTKRRNTVFHVLERIGSLENLEICKSEDTKNVSNASEGI